MKLPLTDQEKQEIVELFKTGKYDYEQLCKKYDKSKWTIGRFLKKNNIHIYNERLTNIEQTEIIELYNTGKYSVYNLADKYNKKIQTIYRLLHKKNIKVIIWGSLTDSEGSQIIELYKTGKYSIAKLARQFKRDEGTISKHLKDNGLEPKPSSVYTRKYPIKEDFFDSIDTQEKAYFLGFLYADGYNYNAKSKISLKLQEQDKKILIQLNNLIQPTKPLYHIIRPENDGYKNGKNQYLLSMNSRHMSDRLSELGLTQAKTFTLTFPEWLDKDLIRHFIRGYMDGDGYVNKRRDNAQVAFVSTLLFCEKLKEIISDILSVRSSICIHKSYNIRILRIYGPKQVMKLLDWIYKDSTIHLQRKHNAYLTLKENMKDNKKCISAAITTLSL